MTLKSLRWSRFFVPALVIFVLFYIYSEVTKDVEIVLPNNVKDLIWSAPVLVSAFLYHTLPLRHISNQYFYNQVNENLRAGIVEIGNKGNDDKRVEWSDAKAIFYNLVDNDKTLSTKASNAYFNGLWWTTWADIRIISIFFLFLSLIKIPQQAEQGLTLSAIYGGILLLSVYVSAHLTKRHLSIGNEQLDHIRVHLSDKVENSVASIISRKNSASHPQS